MKILRDLGRRRLRTTLTVLGITIGIWALVVFGSMANKINSIVDGGSQFYADKVTVAANGSGIGPWPALRHQHRRVRSPASKASTWSCRR